MYDPFDINLQDDDLLDEVELTTNLMIAAAACPERRMRPENVDELLGVHLHGP